MRAAGTAERYVPIDVSATFLSQTAARLRREYPGLAVEPAVADISEELNLRAACRGLRCSPSSAAPSATSIRPRPSGCWAGAGGDGAGRPVPHGRGPAEGCRADRGGLQRQPGRHRRVQPEHAAGAEPRAGRRLRSRARSSTGPSTTRWRTGSRCISSRLGAADGPDSRASGWSRSRTARSIRTEISCKYDRESVAALFEAAGLRIEAWRTDPEKPVRAWWSERAGMSTRSPAPRSPPTLPSTSSPRRRAARSRRGGSGRRSSSFRWRALTGRRCPIEGDGASRHAAVPPPVTARGRAGGRRCTAKGTPCFDPPRRRDADVRARGAARVQLAPVPLRRARCSRPLRAVVLPLRAAAAGEGIDLLAGGHRSVQRRRPRARCCSTPSAISGWPTISARRGPAGATDDAADRRVPGEPRFRRRARLALAGAQRGGALRHRRSSPILRSTTARPPATRARAPQVWRTLDPARTGLPWDERAPVEAYLDFALAAPAILLPLVGGEHPPFGEWLARAQPTADEWHDHLSTLFPEVRPRGHFELRSADAVAPRWYAAPLALAVGYHLRPRRPPRRRRPARLSRSSACSSARDAWVSTTPRSRGPLWTCRISRCSAAQAWVPATSIPRIWSRRAPSSSAIPAGVARRRTRRRGPRSPPSGVV